MEQKWKIVVGLVIVCFMVLITSFVAGSNIGFTSGHNEGYDAGYGEGYDYGYYLGYLEGNAYGYENGYDSGLKVGRTHGYNIMDPTYSEMMEFIGRDKTNENEYVESAYTCYDFAADVCKNADKENIRCAFVGIWFPVEAHAVVAFNTIDRGLIFIEPITDEEVKIEIGKPYWSREQYLPPDYDDTVEEIVVIW